MQWYYTKNSEKQGPITESELQELAARDQLNPDDLVWHAGLSEWTKAVDIPGLLAPPPLASELASPELVQQNNAPPPNSIPGTAGDNTVKRVEKKRSYIRRHWDGDLSLAQSFWVNNFLINITVHIAMLVVEEMPHLAEENPQGYAIGILLFVIASLPVTIWQWVGLFRCAQRHIQEGISRGWANVTMVLLVLGVIGGTMAYIRDFPVYRDLSRIVLNYATTYDYDISLANNNTEVRIDGGFGPGLTADVESLLREHSEIRTIHLNSQGGLIDEGRRLAVLIRNNWLDTYTSERCVSACTLAFLAGKQRFIKKDAVLGFHQYVVFESTGSTRQTEEEKDRDLMIKAGIDADFLERAYSTPHESMWSPTKEQLLDAGVVTSVTEGTEYSRGKPISSSYTSADIAKELLSVPLYASLKMNDPNAFNEIVSIFDAKLKDGASLDAITGLTTPLLQAQIYSRISHADDDTLLGFVDLLIDELQVLNKKKSLLCMQFLFPERFGQVALGPHFSESIIAREMGVMIDIMETYDPQRSIPEVTEEQESLLTIAALKASNVYANYFDFLEHLEIPESDYKDACAATLTMYDTIKALPREDAVPILRSIFAQ